MSFLLRRQAEVEEVVCLKKFSVYSIILKAIAGFDVARTGVASVGFIGFPSVGKSTLMSKLTGQHSEGKDFKPLDSSVAEMRQLLPMSLPH